jgi:hypothetical protein
LALQCVVNQDIVGQFSCCAKKIKSSKNQFLRFFKKLSIITFAHRTRPLLTVPVGGNCIAIQYQGYLKIAFSDGFDVYCVSDIYEQDVAGCLVLKKVDTFC